MALFLNQSNFETKQEEHNMNKSPKTTAEKVCLSEEILRDVIDVLGKALKPQVYYHPDPHQMTEDALKKSQSHVQAALKKLLDSLPPGHWLMQEVAEVVVSGEDVWNRYPF